MTLLHRYLFCALEDWHFHILRGGGGGGVGAKLLDLMLEYCWSLYVPPEPGAGCELQVLND
jgi:hypothetical protein